MPLQRPEADTYIVRDAHGGWELKTSTFIKAKEFVLAPFDCSISAHAWDELCMRHCWPSDLGVQYQSTNGPVVVFSGTTPDLFKSCNGIDEVNGERIMNWRSYPSQRGPHSHFPSHFMSAPAPPPDDLVRGAPWYFCNCECVDPTLELSRQHYCILKDNAYTQHTKMRVFVAKRDIMPGESLTWNYGCVSNPFVQPVVHLSNFQGDLLPEVPFAFPMQNWVSEPSYMPAAAPDAEVLSANTFLSDADSTADVVYAMLSLG